MRCLGSLMFCTYSGLEKYHTSASAGAPREPNAEHCSSSVLPLRSSLSLPLPSFLPSLFPSDLAALSVFPPFCNSRPPSVRDKKRGLATLAVSWRAAGLRNAQLAVKVQKRGGFQSEGANS